MEREQRETMGCCRRSTNSAVCFGERRNSQGKLGTDRLFTGQRLDDTGLYYYGARYYDPTIGRFISADPIIPSFANPQSFNRYSYVLNNPLKYIDPTGLDVFFVGGAGMNDVFNEESNWWDVPDWAYQILISLAHDKKFNEEDERVVFIGDQPNNFGFEADDQYAQLINTLTEGFYTNIKIIGYSEGAAATAMLLADIAGDMHFTMRTDIRGELKAAFLLETPTSMIGDWVVTGFDRKIMHDLPDKLYGIKVGEIYNRASMVHTLGPTPGWESHSEVYGNVLLRGSPDSPIDWLITLTVHHPDVKTSPDMIEYILGVLNS